MGAKEEIMAEKNRIAGLARKNNTTADRQARKAAKKAAKKAKKAEKQARQAERPPTGRKARKRERVQQQQQQQQQQQHQQKPGQAEEAKADTRFEAVTTADVVALHRKQAEDERQRRIKANKRRINQGTAPGAGRRGPVLTVPTPDLDVSKFITPCQVAFEEEVTRTREARLVEVDPALALSRAEAEERAQAAEAQIEATAQLIRDAEARIKALEKKAKRDKEQAERREKERRQRLERERKAAEEELKKKAEEAISEAQRREQQAKKEVAELEAQAAAIMARLAELEQGVA
jgi:hypothetical protein